MKIPKQQITILHPKIINQIPTLTLSLNSKQDLRSIITDYVLHHIQQQNHTIPSRRFKSKHIKYPNINLKVNINKQDRDVSFQFVHFLAKYIEIEKKNIYRQERIEPLVVDILNFFDQMEERTKGVTFQIQNTQNIKKMQQEVLKLIIQKHHKDKQKKCHSVQIDQYKKKVVAKHARISYIDIQDHLKKKQKQFLLQISQLQTLNIKSDTHTNKNIIIPPPISSSSVFQQLDKLIDSGQLFENTTKIQALKKQKMLEFYQSNQAEYLSYQAMIADQIQGFNCVGDQCNNTGKNGNNGQLTSQCLTILKDWVIDIGLSQKYYQIKFGKNQKKKMLDLDLDQKVMENMGLI